jgi:hypothetical protein
LRTSYASYQIVALPCFGGPGFRFWLSPARRKRHEQLRFHRPGNFPIDDQISLLHAADLDGDGLNDLIVANNLRSKINLLYNQTGKTNRAAANPRANSKSTNCRPTRAFALIPFPPTSASPRWW